MIRSQSSRPAVPGFRAHQGGRRLNKGTTCSLTVTSGILPGLASLAGGGALCIITLEAADIVSSAS